MPTKIPLLVLNSLSSAHQAQIAEVYDMTYAFDAVELQRVASIAQVLDSLEQAPSHVIDLGNLGLVGARKAVEHQQGNLGRHV